MADLEDSAAADAFINREDGRKYWEGIDADNNGMLGGFAFVSKVDLQQSRNFLAKLGIGRKDGLRIVDSALEGGAGIGRVTEGLLLNVAKEVDVIEPIAKFTAALDSKSGVRSIYNVGLEDWECSKGVLYGLIWTQWCVGHLTDDQLVRYLQRCSAALEPDGGIIVIKENLSASGMDTFDDEDSSVTREDAKFRSLFEQANLRLIKTELQKGFPTEPSKQLLPVRMYALKPSPATSQ